MRLRLATRSSPLALVQARLAADALQDANAGLQVELVPIVSDGDRIAGSLADHGGKDLFVRALEVALIDDQADAACHSLKDIGAVSDQFALAGMLERATAQDALVGCTLDKLKQMKAPRIGTSSPRRQALVRRLLPHAELTALRGNVETRIARIDEGKINAAILAASGLERLGHSELIAEILSAADFLPAPGQGIIALECLNKRSDIASVLASIDNAQARAAATAERAVAAAVAGNCHTPLGAYATIAGQNVSIDCQLLDPDSSKQACGKAAGPDPSAAGKLAAQRMLEAGGKEIMESIRAT